MQPEIAHEKRNRITLLGACAVVGLALGVAAVVLSSIPAHFTATPDYDPAMVVFDQPLEGRYAAMAMHHQLHAIDPGDFAPRLQLPQTSVALGMLAEGNAVEHTFVLYNNGQGVLRIEQVYTTCACLMAHLTASVIPSGRMALLTVRLDPARVMPQAAETVGVRYGVFLEGNDPRWPQASVWVEATLPDRE